MLDTIGSSLATSGALWLPSSAGPQPAMRPAATPLESDGTSISAGVAESPDPAKIEWLLTHRPRRCNTSQGREMAGDLPFRSRLSGRLGGAVGRGSGAPASLS